MRLDDLRPRLVPDASVMLKWVLDAENEPGSTEAHQLLQKWGAGEIELWVPSLWIYEVGNVLCLKRPNVAGELLRALLALDLHELATDRGIVELTAGLATQYSVTFYDAAYLAAATVCEGTLVTADRRYPRAVGDSQPITVL